MGHGQDKFSSHRIKVNPPVTLSRSVLWWVTLHVIKVSHSVMAKTSGHGTHGQEHVFVT
jgi:cytochrome c-type biogenesis protein CcmH/NrfF